MSKDSIFKGNTPYMNESSDNANIFTGNTNDLMAGADSTIDFVSPKLYTWKPKENITTYELAQCMEVLMLVSRLGFEVSVEQMVNDLPKNCQRHFEEYN